jgi:hypothetical protein
MRAVIVGVVIVGTLAGCITAAMNLERASARAILPTPNPDSVRITEVRQGLVMSRWIATTRDGVYDCSIEADEKVPICAKRAVPR